VQKFRNTLIREGRPQTIAEAERLRARTGKRIPVSRVIARKVVISLGAILATANGEVRLNQRPFRICQIACLALTSRSYFCRVISVHMMCLDDCYTTTMMPQPTEITQFIFGQPLRHCRSPSAVRSTSGFNSSFARGLSLACRCGESRVANRCRYQCLATTRRQSPTACRRGRE